LIILVIGICQGAFAKDSKVHETALKGPFATPQDVTKACIKCHKKQADDFGKSRHWTWEGRETTINGKKVKLGKRKNSINNFCINIVSNEPRCTSCHAGYGWKDGSFDFSKHENMDCLVCHEQTGTYKKFPVDAGYPVYQEDKKVFEEKDVFEKVDLAKSAQSVGRPTNKNCGACHFFGGGGHAVKHGDLDKSLLTANEDLDVHMGKLKMQCADCHAKKGSHAIKGASYSSMALGDNHFACNDCHKNGHKGGMAAVLNNHVKSVACETCHVPVVAKEFATKVWWDWTKAGDKSRAVEKDELGNVTYVWKKGEFKWEKNLKPIYMWYNGSTDYYMPGDKIASAEDFHFNMPHGNIKDKKALIAPFRLMKGKQFYDTETKMLLVPKLFGKTGYWMTADWNSSFELGMKEMGLPYSGKYGPVTTTMYWKVDHMVNPAKKALNCNDCHGDNGRLDWKALGYEGDPQKTGKSRKTMKIVK